MTWRGIGKGADMEDSKAPEQPTRQEHLAWCKQRALEYAEQGDSAQALASLVTDMGQHPGTATSVATISELGTMLAMAGHLDTPQEMREWINGVG